MKKFDKFCSCSLSVIGCIIISFLTYFSFVATAYMYDGEDTLFIRDNILLNIVAVVFVCFLAVFLVKKKINVTDRFLKIYCGISFVLTLWFILSTQLVSIDDQSQVLSVASAWLHNSIEPWTEGGYCFRWGHQNGIVLIYTLFSMIFGENNYVCFQILNLIFVSLTYFYIYKTYTLVHKETTVAKVILIALATFIPYIFYVTYIYGTVIGMMFATIGIHYILRFTQNTQKRFIAIGAICFGIATVCKSNYFIFVIAAIIIIIVWFLSNNKEERKKLFGKSSILILSIIIACIVGRVTTTAIVEARINGDAPKGAPTVLFVVMGMQEGWKAPGWCNSFDDIMYQQSNYDQALANENGINWLKKETAEFLYNPDYAVKFFTEKLGSIWINPTFECFEILRDRQSNTGVPKLISSFIDRGSFLNSVVIELMDVIQTLLLFGVILYLILNLTRGDFRRLSFLLVFVGAFIFYIFWEARCHYTVPIVIYLIPYAILGYRDFALKVNNIIDGNKDLVLKKNISLFVGICIVAVMSVITGMMVNYSIIYEKDAYKTYIDNYAYGSRLEDGVYTITPNDDQNLVLSFGDVDSQTALCLKEASDTMDEKFTFSYNLSVVGNNHYYIWNEIDDKLLYLRPGETLYNGSIYAYNYVNTYDNQWTLRKASDDCYYILHTSGLALTYNLYTNEVVLFDFSGDSSQMWTIRSK